MASADATSEETFASLAKIGSVFGIQQSGMSVVRSIDLLGQDIINALDQESKRNPSAEYGLFLQGFIATVKQGGDLKAYLAAMSEKQVEDRKRSLTKLITQLNFVAEVFIIGIVAFPVIMIILLTVMESIGGSVLADLSGLQIMMLMTYLLVPIAAVGVIILTDIVMEGQQ
jgi:archaellum biogenesis protein FlaJ (TadC family)